MCLPFRRSFSPFRSPGKPLCKARRISTLPPRSRSFSRRSSFPWRSIESLRNLGIHREVDTVVGIGPTMLAGMALVALSMVVMLRVTSEADSLAREDLAFALSVVLLGLLMMVTRGNAVSQVIGFMSLENGLILAATGAKGMPLVVEISVAFSVLIAFIVIGIFLFRIRERFDTVDLEALDRLRGDRFRGGPRMNAITLNGVTFLLAIPVIAAAMLAVLPGYRAVGRSQYGRGFPVPPCRSVAVHLEARAWPVTFWSMI